MHYINIGPYVLAMAFLILSPTFSLFATNILKLLSTIYVPAWLHGMPFLLLNQFLGLVERLIAHFHEIILAKKMYIRTQKELKLFLTRNAYRSSTFR